MLVVNLLLLLSAGAGAVIPDAVPVHVAIDVRGTVQDPRQLQGRIEAVPVAARGADTPVAPISVPFEGRAERTLYLVPGRVWELRAHSKGWWTRQIPVYVTGDQTAATIDLWPECELAGTLHTTSREELPASVKVWFRPVAERQSESENRGASRAGRWWQEFEEVACDLNGSAFRCVVPATTLDLKLRARGFVSHYWWSKLLPEHGSIDLGRLALRPGASLVGFVITVAGPPDPQECKVVLAPQIAGNEPSEEGLERSRLREHKTMVDGGGFYSFDGIEPGLYRLEARQEGFAPAIQSHIWVEERTELQGETLVLERPLDLTVEVRPPRDPYGGRWTLEVLAVDEQYRRTSVHRSQVAENGVMQEKGLARGRYELLLEDSGGSRLLDSEIELQSSSTAFTLEPNLVPLSGRVTLGTNPLAARLSFGRRDDGASIAMDSDGDGQYSGFLTGEGRWRVEVTAEHPLVHGAPLVEVRYFRDLGEARVDIALPGTSLRGGVVGEDGQPVAGATVEIFGASNENVHTTSDEQGRFQVAGLAVGPVTVVASEFATAGARASDPATVLVSASPAGTSVQLVLKRSREITVRVVDEWGRGVFGARVDLLQDLAEGLVGVMPEGVTDLAGEVRLRVPQRISRWTMQVAAQGHCFGVFELRPSKERVVTVALGRYGGTLHVRVPGPLFPEDYYTGAAFVWLDGRLLATTTLVQWAMINGCAVAPKAQELRLPAMPEGQYLLCLVPPIALLNAGGTPPQRSPHCTDGFLPPLGELELSPR